MTSKKRLNELMQPHNKPLVQQGMNGLTFRVSHPDIKLDHFRYPFRHHLNVEIRDKGTLIDSALLPISMGVHRELFTHEVMEIVARAIPAESREQLLTRVKQVIERRWLNEII